MKVLIVSNGEVKDIDILNQYIADSDFVICADGGANHLIKQGMYPSVLIGDLDSIESNVLDKLKASSVTMIKYPSKKSKTDTELAIDYAIENGAQEIVFMGVTGSRLDHTLANIMLMFKVKSRGVKCKIVDRHNEIYLIDNSLCLENRKDTYVSIIPVGDEDLIVSLEGFEYKLNREKVSKHSTLGISNKIISSFGKIIIHGGMCLVIQSKD